MTGHETIIKRNLDLFSHRLKKSHVVTVRGEKAQVQIFVFASHKSALQPVFNKAERQLRLQRPGAKKTGQV